MIHKLNQSNNKWTLLFLTIFIISILLDHELIGFMCGYIILGTFNRIYSVNDDEQEFVDSSNNPIDDHTTPFFTAVFFLFWVVKGSILLVFDELGYGGFEQELVSTAATINALIVASLFFLNKNCPLFVILDRKYIKYTFEKLKKGLKDRNIAFFEYSLLGYMADTKPSSCKKELSENNKIERTMYNAIQMFYTTMFGVALIHKLTITAGMASF
jgi:hypothetical protein